MKVMVVRVVQPKIFADVPPGSWFQVVGENYGEDYSEARYRLEGDEWAGQYGEKGTLCPNTAVVLLEQDGDLVLKPV